jgi:hypothetical protein
LLSQTRTSNNRENIEEEKKEDNPETYKTFKLVVSAVTKVEENKMEFKLYVYEESNPDKLI